MSLLLQISHKDKQAVSQISTGIKKRMKNEKSFSDIVLFCIGTDRCTGDSLGPLVGMFLQQANVPDIQVWGTLERPIHALNLKDALYRLSLMSNPLVISVDASLGITSCVGDIQLVDGPLRPGMGVRKILPPVGHFHIKGIVNTSGILDAMVLLNTRLFTVMQMAKVISQSVILAVKKK
ncbi:spore protease YyaC [Ammoniphilus oxalaticus]|uniref:spore protease YyaC n=1 Tax=Ammoniphilus oxalaticus TaxID=66863 RepID=UPI001472E433|nr:spore protease YyaC [Ammoniphilus oxalaticus]